MTYTQIVKKLIGKIKPVGETNEDDRRFENLKEMCELVNQLVTDIDLVAYTNKDRVEHSMNKAGKYADEFLTKKLGITE